ncbi:uncharacterized protein LOC123904282 [Trifolium pratense]|uniref:uncharacterized protein LOC123904282 n=1 Tax=Trifolium pratense TaxID=57577 RepID=UPI001E691E8A|nr:uncharacterized protein LOC123904282 [Trifolium pratense]
MASSSNKFQVPFAGKWNDFSVADDGMKYVPEPKGSKEHREIWESQVMIPFAIDNNVYAFGGPIPDDMNLTREVDEIFPCLETCEPRIFDSKPYNFEYMLTNYKPFRSHPYYGNSLYLTWLDRMEQSFGKFWKDYGIFELIQFSRIGPKYQPEMLIAAMHFFEKSTNTFHFKSGMMTPTLFDVSAITGLRPTGKTYSPDDVSDNITLNYKENAFSAFILKHSGPENEEVSDEEHVAFLTLWLSHYVFCSRSLQIARKFIPMAVQIHEGCHFALGRLLLATLYESIGEVCDNLKGLVPAKSKSKKAAPDGCFQAAGPMWLLQLWLNATFEKELGLFIPTEHHASIAKRKIEGTRLIRLQPNPLEQNSQQLFMKYMKIFLAIDQFKPEHAPFVKRTIGPSWFVKEIPVLNPNAEEEINETWTAYLDPTILSIRIGTLSSEYALIGYQPNLVSRQFGFSQLRPKSMYIRKKNIVLGTTVTSTLYERYMKISRDNVYGFEPFDFNLSYYCTQEFANWWRRYFDSKHLGDAVLISRLESGFTRPQIKRIEQQVKTTVTKKQAADSAKTVKEKTTSKSVESEEPSKARKRPTNVPSTETGPSKKPKPNTIVVSDEEEEEEEQSFQRKRGQPSVIIETNIPETTSDNLSTEEKEKKMKEKREKQERKAKRKEEKKKEGKKSSEDRTRDKKHKKSKSSSDPSATNLKSPSISNEQQEPIPDAEVQEDAAMPDATLKESDNMPQQDNNPEDILSNKSSGDTLKDSETTISEKVIPEPSQDQSEPPMSAEIDNKTSPFKEWNENPTVEVDADESSSEEEDFDSEAIKEAEAGGSELLPETSTSKLSASLGLAEEEFISLQIHDPEAALKLLISKTTTDPVSSSGPSNSTASDSEINSSVRQDSLISKLYTDFINGDILASVEEHPANAFKHKSFLNKLHNPQTDLETLRKVIQLESILDQFATTVQNLKRNSQKLVGQQAAYDALFEKAMAAQSKVDQMKAQVQQPGLGIQECTNNISKWEAEIDSFRAEIADREKKILEEKAKRVKIEEAVAATTQESIREAAKEGISHFSAATVIKEEIKSLEDAIKIQTVEVGLIKDHYADFKSKCLS